MHWINRHLLLCICGHVIGVFLASQSASQKHNKEKKSPQTFAHLVNFSKNVSATFDNHVIMTIE